MSCVSSRHIESICWFVAYVMSYQLLIVHRYPHLYLEWGGDETIRYSGKKNRARIMINEKKRLKGNLWFPTHIDVKTCTFQTKHFSNISRISDGLCLWYAFIIVFFFSSVGQQLMYINVNECLIIYELSLLVDLFTNYSFVYTFLLHIYTLTTHLITIFFVNSKV